MPHTIYLKEVSSKRKRYRTDCIGAGTSIISIHYSALSNRLRQYPSGFVGVEIPSDGTMQHYFYQMDASAKEIRRYPIRNIADTYSCMRMYTPLLDNTDDNEKYFGTPQQALQPPSLPNEPGVYFTESDIPAINTIKATERSEKLKVKETTPYFPELELTKLQQQFLYDNYVLNNSEPFKEILEEILNHKTLGIDDKQTILRGCISKRRIQISGESEILMRNLQKNFLAIESIVNYPVENLCSTSGNKRKKIPPSLGAIQAFYIRCIQSHLERPVERNELNLIPPLTAILSLGTIPSTEEKESYKGLTEKEETCFNALNALLMSGPLAKNEPKVTIIKNPKFMEILDDLYEIVSDLKDAVVHRKSTTSKPEYEMIYREFFIAHEIELESLHRLKTLKPAHQALKELQKISSINKQCATLNTASSKQCNTLKAQLQRLLTAPLIEINELAAQHLVNHQLLSADERKTLFLESVVACKMNITELLLKQDPQLLLHQANVTETYSGRQFKNITAAQYACWALDTDMFEMLMKHIRPDAEGDEIKKQLKLQIDVLKKNGITYTWTDDDEQRDIKESCYNYKKLIDAYKAYIKYIKKDNASLDVDDEADRLWLLIGSAQHNMPEHVIHHYCNPDESFDPTPKFDKPLRVRSTYINDDPPNRVHWGTRFTLIRGDDDEADVIASWAGTFYARSDLAAVTALFKVKTEQLELLQNKLVTSQQHHQHLVVNCSRYAGGFYGH